MSAWRKGCRRFRTKTRATNERHAPIAADAEHMEAPSAGPLDWPRPAFLCRLWTLPARQHAGGVEVRRCARRAGTLARSRAHRTSAGAHSRSLRAHSEGLWPGLFTEQTDVQESLSVLSLPRDGQVFGALG